MNPLALIEKYYLPQSPLYHILLTHSRSVAHKAAQIADSRPELHVDREFLCEASLLHDIGIFETNAPGINCFGSLPYIMHGMVGSELLTMEGYPRHALVCERHTGAGLSKEEIIAQNLPLPHIDLLPQSMEEQIICFADCFFSKTRLNEERTVEQVREKMQKYGRRSLQQFDKWCEMFL
jgi:uncharacterized protein